MPSSHKGHFYAQLLPRDDSSRGFFVPQHFVNGSPVLLTPKGIGMKTIAEMRLPVITAHDCIVGNADTYVAISAIV
jgi:hypothetical protein